MMFRSIVLISALLFFHGSVFAGSGNKDYSMPDFVDPENIQIVRDSFGVPHIFAPTDAEVAYGLAWATLEDDSETAQFLFHASKGFMGRSEGIDGAAIDYAVQLTRVRERAGEYLEKEIPDDFRRVVEAYCAGVNAYFARHWDELKIKRAFPLEPIDLITGYMLGMGMMSNIDASLRSIVEGTIQERIPELPESPSPIGSNVIAFGPSRTVDGSTYLDINSHQPLEGILSWYEAHLCSEEGWNITGGLFHGGLSVFHGANEYLGWAHTVGDFDKADVFILKMKEDSKQDLYQYGEEWRALEKGHARLRVGLGKKHRFVLPVRKKIWWSEFGPTIKTKSGVFALRMPALMEPRAAEQWWRMNKARNLEEFKEVLSMQGLSMMNIGYADREGNIYFLSNGLIPKRKEGVDWEGPVWGTGPSLKWDDYYSIEELAFTENPDCGYIFNTNNSPFFNTCREENLDPADFSENMGYPDEDNNRSLRFYELMETYPGKISWQDFLDIKFDHTYPKDTMCFVRDYEIMSLLDISPEDHPDIADAIGLIQSWDRKADSLNTRAGIVFFTIYEMYDRSGGVKEEQLKEDAGMREKFFVDCIRLARNHMIRHFGSMEVPFGRIHVLERGGKVVPMNGGPEMLRNAAARLMDDDSGRRRIWIGDSFIQLVRFSESGPEIYSISPFGASNKPDSPHYNDQMELFSRHQFKKMSLDKQYWFDRAERIYHPE
jgi:acyl-homoserine-lactone acylase